MIFSGLRLCLNVPLHTRYHVKTYNTQNRITHESELAKLAMPLDVQNYAHLSRSFPDSSRHLQAPCVACSLTPAHDSTNTHQIHIHTHTHTHTQTHTDINQHTHFSRSSLDSGCPLHVPCVVCSLAPALEPHRAPLRPWVWALPRPFRALRVRLEE